MSEPAPAGAGPASGEAARRRRRSARALLLVAVLGFGALGAGLFSVLRERRAEDEEIEFVELPNIGQRGTRFGGRRNMVARGGGSIATESAVEAGLKWLARHQSSEGDWDPAGFDRVCRGKCDGYGSSSRGVGVTGLSLLAFLAAGYSPCSKESYQDPVTGKAVAFGRVTRRGLAALVSEQGNDGRFGVGGPDGISNHALATAAVCEGYWLTGAPRYALGARRGVEFLLAARNADGGWGNAPRSGASDSQDTGWAILALESAELTGIGVPKNLFAEARAWLDADTSGVGSLSSSRPAGALAGNPTREAIALLAHAFPRKQQTEYRIAKGPVPEVLAGRPPAWSFPGASEPNDFEYRFWGSLAIFQTNGPAGPHWKRWNKAIANDLCMNQGLRKDGCRDGSWECDGADPWTRAGGRVASTALATLTLETYYRYPR